MIKIGKIIAENKELKQKTKKYEVIQIEKHHVSLGIKGRKFILIIILYLLLFIFI